MKLVYPQRNTIIFGFDSAWTDNPKQPGAICAIAFNDQGDANFMVPELASFAKALNWITEKQRGFAFSLVALDQPTIVPNHNSMRPVEKVAASLISFVGGGVQSANRSKQTMFGDDAPIWWFLDRLKAKEFPHEARTASSGHFLIEVFPALALTALNPNFAKRLGHPKYNPGNRKKFCIEDWKAVVQTLSEKAEAMGINGLSTWAKGQIDLSKPRKADQDRLDAALCALIGLIWRGGPTENSAMIGDTKTGYMITPVSPETLPQLKDKAKERDVEISQ